MTWHPEQFDRGSDRQPYDPDEPLVVRWADVVAARNAAQALLVVLKDAEVDLEATSRVVGWQVRDWLPLRSASALTSRSGHRRRPSSGLRSWFDGYGAACRSPSPPGNARAAASSQLRAPDGDSQSLAIWSRIGHGLSDGH
jgi:hypothetical protein